MTKSANTSHKVQTPLSSEGNSAPASSRSISVGSVPNACAETCGAASSATKPISRLSNEICQPDYRDHTTAATNHEFAAWQHR